MTACSKKKRTYMVFKQRENRAISFLVIYRLLSTNDGFHFFIRPIETNTNKGVITIYWEGRATIIGERATIFSHVDFNCQPSKSLIMCYGKSLVMCL